LLAVTDLRFDQFPFKVGLAINVSSLVTITAIGCVGMFTDFA
jgi:hypothetical protein